MILHLNFDSSNSEFSVKVTIPEKDGYTPFHGAGFQGRATIAKMLLNHLGDHHGMKFAREKHADGFEPIFRAVWGNTERHTETVKVRSGIVSAKFNK